MTSRSVPSQDPGPGAGASGETPAPSPPSTRGDGSDSDRAQDHRLRSVGNTGSGGADRTSGSSGRTSGSSSGTDGSSGSTSGSADSTIRTGSGSERAVRISGGDRIRRADRARQVADILRQQIHTGTFEHALPTEADLAAEFAVSRNTVRDALALLKDERLIERAPKVGTHVAQRKYDHGLDTLRGLKETLRGHGEVRNEVRVARRVDPPPAVARRLRLEPGEQAVYLERLRYLGDLPLSLDLTYLAPDIGAAVLTHDLETNDIFALIEEISGGPLGSADLALEAITADAHSAATLQMPEGGALLLLERLTRLDDGRPVDLEYIRMRGDRITMRGSLFRPADASDWRLIR